METAFITYTISALRHPLITSRVSARVFTLANRATLIVAMLHQSRSARFQSHRAFEPNSQHYTHKALASILETIAIHNVARHQFSTPHISTLFQLLLMFSLHFLWTFFALWFLTHRFRSITRTCLDRSSCTEIVGVLDSDLRDQHDVASVWKKPQLSYKKNIQQKTNKKTNKNRKMQTFTYSSNCIHSDCCLRIVL